MINWIKPSTVNQFNQSKKLSPVWARVYLTPSWSRVLGFMLIFMAFLGNELVRVVWSDLCFKFSVSGEFALHYTQICSIIMDHPAHMPPSFPWCIVIHVLISDRWLNLETREAFFFIIKPILSRFFLFFIFKKAKTKKILHVFQP